MTLIERIGKIGFNRITSAEHKKLTKLINYVSVVMVMIAIIIFFSGWYFFGFTWGVQFSLVCCILFFIPLIINFKGYYNLSRVIFSVEIAFVSIILSLIDKLNYIILEDFQYFVFRVFILCSSLLPFAVFKLSERYFLLATLLFNLSILILYDPIHNFFSVGYYQLGLTDPNYYFLNITIFCCFILLTVYSYLLRANYETTEYKSNQLINQLSQEQSELIKSNEFSILQQEKLTIENEMLTRELFKKNIELSKTNQELIKHNNELQQFSYTISHNLRGPVASLLGLMKLTNTATLDSTNLEIHLHIQKSITLLDNTIRELTNIVDIRNSISNFYQQIILSEEVNFVLKALQKEIIENDIIIDCNFEVVNKIYSVKSMVNNILYNLISNAIKYRAKDRKLMVTISTEKSDDFIKIKIEDNGIGLDTQKFRDKIFGLYNRFHTHVDGKGLGLFLVKLQAESLGGNVTIKSTPNIGTCFTVYIPGISNQNQKIKLDKSRGVSYYDA